MIVPNYELFVQIFFAMFVLRGIVYLVAGLAEVDRPRSDKCGGTEILVGFVTLLLAAWVVL